MGVRVFVCVLIESPSNLSLLATLLPRDAYGECSIGTMKTNCARMSIADRGMMEGPLPVIKVILLVTFLVPFTGSGRSCVVALSCSLVFVPCMRVSHQHRTGAHGDHS